MGTITLIRHGMTKGNLERRYVGSTDEGLIVEEKSRLSLQRDESVKLVYISPMKRTFETAHILFPKAELVPVEDFRECDFGQYEYMNHEELDGLEPYRRFIDSRGFEGFPGGEGRAGFSERVTYAFETLVSRERDTEEDIYIVAHGGTIMAIMEKTVIPHKDFYEWICGNGEGYVIRSEGKGHYSVCGVYP